MNNSESSNPNVHVEDFVKTIAQQDVVLIDIRTAQEFAEGFIERAINIDFYKEEFESEIKKLPKEFKYALYCRSGHRSGLALKLMQDQGFSGVCHLEGGILEWAIQGKPILNKEESVHR